MEGTTQPPKPPAGGGAAGAMGKGRHYKRRRLSQRIRRTRHGDWWALPPAIAGMMAGEGIRKFYAPS